jgi:hypothetical protein
LRTAAAPRESDLTDFGLPLIGGVSGVR